MDELDAVQHLLKARAMDLRVRMVPGLSEDLTAIAAAFGLVQRQLGTLAEFTVRANFGLPGRPHPAVMESLRAIGPGGGDKTRNMLAIAAHGERCTCELCMRGFDDGQAKK